MSQGSPDSLDAARAAVAAACAEAEGLLARARALREAGEALRVRFDPDGILSPGRFGT